MAAPRVIDDLKTWGPDDSGPVLSLTAAQAYCRNLATTHYENFPVASLFLPGRLRQHFLNVYAFCRWADDLGDEVHDSNRALELLSWWRSELHRCFDGEASHPVFIALQPTIRQFRIPLEPFADLISAFEQDQHVKQYDSFEQLQDYCRRSADPVGRIVLRLCDRYEPQHVVWSDAICTGLQLANFWQDVSRDYDIGRVYLPREDREQFDYRDSDIAERVTTSQFRELLAFEVDRTRELLLSGAPLIDRMPGRLQMVIELFLRGGLAVLTEIERIDYAVWEKRPTISKQKLVWELMSARLTSRRSRRWT